MHSYASEPGWHILPFLVYHYLNSDGFGGNVDMHAHTIIKQFYTLQLIFYVLKSFTHTADNGNMGVTRSRWLL